MKKNTHRRIRPSFGYRGAIHNHSNSYTYHRRTPFSKMKEIYGEELERFNFESDAVTIESEALLTQRKKEIKQRVLQQYKNEQKKNMTIICFIIILTIVLVIFVNYYLIGFIRTYFF